MKFAIFLDLYGVLADGRLMDRHYNERMADILWRRFGGDVEDWRLLQAKSFEWYQAEGARLDERPGHEREGDGWVDAVQRLNVDQVRWMFERRGIAMPADPLGYAEALEGETVRGIDALFPDVRPTLRALKAAGHRLFLSTNANRSNAESALIGGGVRELFDGLAMLETARAKKDRPYYWQRALEMSAPDSRHAVAIDDVARYLDPAAELGIRCLQLVRPGLDRPRGGHPVIQTLEALSTFLTD